MNASAAAAALGDLQPRVEYSYSLIAPNDNDGARNIAG